MQQPGALRDTRCQAPTIGSREGNLKRAGERTRTVDIQLGKLTFYH